MSVIAGQDSLAGRYRLIDGLGQGGMGTVWQAFDERLQRYVAVKILDSSLSDVDHGRAEALALAQLNHPHIATVFDYGCDHGRPYLVMELARGQSLAALLSQGTLPWPVAAAAAAQVASALAAAHTRGLVHRDVKPGNIMLTPAGAKLIDFGISAVDGENDADANGELRGTPEYVAPERLRGAVVAPPADVYALGVVLCRALTGEPPGDSALPEAIPPDLAELCHHLLDPAPARRPDAASAAQSLAETAGPPGFRALEQLAANSDDDYEITRELPLPSTIDGHLEHRGVASTKDGFAERRAVAAILGAAAAIVAGTLALAWSTAGSGPVADNALPLSEQPAARPACDATFNLAAADAGRFTVEIVATPTDGPLPAGWRVSLPLPVEGIGVDEHSGWVRAGQTLTSPAQDELAAGEPAQLSVQGTHTGAIPLPTAIQINGSECRIAGAAVTQPPASPAEPAVAAAAPPPPPPRPEHVRPNPPAHGRPGTGGPGPAHQGRASDTDSQGDDQD